MARPGLSAGQGLRVQSIIVTLVGAAPLVAFAAHTIKLLMPQTGQFVGATLNIGTRGGTHVTSAIDVQDDGVSILAATFDVDALTPGTPVNKEGSALAAGAASVAKDSVLSIILTESGGTSPTYADATLQLDYIPLGD